jgi:thiamine monophosphate kinase
VADVCAELRLPAWELAAGAGEDYELCFCAAPLRRVQVEQAIREVGGAPITWIGEVLEGPAGVSLLDERGDEVQLSGFEHRW